MDSEIKDDGHGKFSEAGVNERPDAVPSELPVEIVQPGDNPFPDIDMPHQVVEPAVNPYVLIVPLGALFVTVLVIAIGLGARLMYTRTEAREALQAGRFELSQSAFIQAVQNGSGDLVGRYLQAGMSPSQKDSHGVSPLRTAVERGDSKILELLLAQLGTIPGESNSNTRFSERESFSQAYDRNCISDSATLLDYTASKGNAQVFSVVHDHSPESESPQANWRPLSCAVASNNSATAGWLIANGVNLDRLEVNGRTALGNAALAEARGTVQLLLDHGANPASPETFGESAIFDAARGGDEEIVTLLLSRPIDLNHMNFRGEKPWQVAETVGRTELVALLHPEYLLYAGLVKENPAVVTFALERGARINISDRDGVTPLLVALSGGMPGQYRFLLKSDTGLSYAAKAGQLPVLANNPSLARQFDTVHRLVKRLERKQGSEPSLFSEDDGLYGELSAPPAILSELDRGKPPVIPGSAISAIQEDRRTFVEILLVGGADVNTADAEGNTPLHYATQRGELPLIDALLHKGASYERTNSEGVSPLLHAVRLKRPDIALEFLNYNPPKEIDANIERVLVSAVETGQNGVADKLLRLGVNPNLTDAAGRQLVIVALTQGNYELAEILVKEGAALELTEKTVQSIYLYARRDRLPRLREFLEKYGTGGENISVEALERQIQMNANINSGRKQKR